jgi:hypothetical protein
MITRAARAKRNARCGACLDFEGLRSRRGQSEAILVTYDVMEVDGEDMRPEPLEERRKRLARLLSRKTRAVRDAIQLSEAITGDRPRYQDRTLSRPVIMPAVVASLLNSSARSRQLGKRRPQRALPLHKETNALAG